MTPAPLPPRTASDALAPDGAPGDPHAAWRSNVLRKDKPDEVLVDASTPALPVPPHLDRCDRCGAEIDQRCPESAWLMPRLDGLGRAMIFESTRRPVFALLYLCARCTDDFDGSTEMGHLLCVGPDGYSRPDPDGPDFAAPPQKGGGGASP